MKPSSGCDNIGNVVFSSKFVLTPLKININYNQEGLAQMFFLCKIWVNNSGSRGSVVSTASSRDLDKLPKAGDSQVTFKQQVHMTFFQMLFMYYIYICTYPHYGSLHIGICTYTCALEINQNHVGSNIANDNTVDGSEIPNNHRLDVSTKPVNNGISTTVPSTEQWKQPWLVRWYRGLYYPVI